MNSFSPTAQGFRLIFRRPTIPFAEIAWRWSFVTAAWFLGAFFIFEYADTLPVRTLDRLLLASRQPAFIARALHRIFYGSAFRFTEAGVILGIALAGAWVLLASLGRAATVNAVLEEFGLSQPVSAGRRFSSLIGLHCLRGSVASAAVIAAAGAGLAGSSVWASTHVSAVAAVRLVGLLLFLVWLAWTALNWWLSTAAILVVAEDVRALAAIASTGRFVQQAPAPVLTTGVFFGMVHLGALIAACGAAFTTLGMIGAVGPGPVLFLELMIVIGYCGLADFLYAGRLAAYVSIMRRGDMPEFQAGARPLPPDVRTAVDQDELILGDLPLPAS